MKGKIMIGFIKKTFCIVMIAAMLLPVFSGCSSKDNADNKLLFHEGLISVRIDGKWGFINKDGEIVIETKYDSVTAFSCGLAAVGIGGKFEAGESPFDCVKREIIEETALIPTKLCYRGIVTFVSNIYGTEYMHLFTCPKFSGELNRECTEGKLEWVKISEVENLPIWEGDKIFFKLLRENAPFFSLKLVYESDKLVSYNLEY